MVELGLLGAGAHADGVAVVVVVSEEALLMEGTFAVVVAAVVISVVEYGVTVVMEVAEVVAVGAQLQRAETSGGATAGAVVGFVELTILTAVIAAVAVEGVVVAAQQTGLDVAAVVVVAGEECRVAWTRSKPWQRGQPLMGP